MEKRILPFLIGSACLIFAASMAFGQGSPNVTLLKHMDPYPANDYNDCWGYTASDGREYALLGVEHGMSIIDITDAANAVEVAFIGGISSIWRDIKTYQDYAYVVNEDGGGMQIVDLSGLPNSAPVAATYSGFSTSHNIYIDEPNAMLYAEGSSGQPVRAISLADPLNPVQVSFFGVECHDIYARNNIVYVSEGSNGTFGIYDLSTPGTPALLQQIAVPSAGYCHNAWLTDDGDYLMTTEETGGKTVKMWDIQNLNNITLIDEYLAPDGLAHNTHIKGDFAYIAHYADGMRIIDVSDPANILEIGFYDTFGGPGGGFNGAWGAYPFFSSGKVLISDIESGLYVVFFEGARDADAEDPEAPTNLTAYSDYTTPSSIALNWADPVTLVNGDTLTNFGIEVWRDGDSLTFVASGVQTLIDNGGFLDGTIGLVDGQFYEYTFFAKDLSTDSLSSGVNASAWSGGAPTPGSPTGLVVTAANNDLVMHWTNPTTQIDGTPLDDFAGIKLYEDGAEVMSYARANSDTGAADSAVYTPPSGTHTYYVTAFDDEIPFNESDPGNSSFSPIQVPVFDPFLTAGDPGQIFWINNNAEVNGNAVNEPSAPNSLDLNGNVGGDDVTLLPVDISSMQDSALIVSYWYQPQGTGNAPENTDSFFVELKNDLGQWRTVRRFGGTNVVPFVNDVIALNAESAGSGATFFHNAFQFRFRTASSPIGSFDDWFVDDVFFGPDQVVGINDGLGMSPGVFALHQNYPNPFNPTTKIRYDLPRDAKVKVSIYNLLGQEIRTLVSGTQTAGYRSVTWDGKNNLGATVSSGIYVYRVQAGSFVKSRKMMFVK